MFAVSFRFGLTLTCLALLSAPTRAQDACEQVNISYKKETLAIKRIQCEAAGADCIMQHGACRPNDAVAKAPIPVLDGGRTPRAVVKTLQEILAEKGFDVPNNGKFGKSTKDAVKQLQEQLGLPPTGQVKIDLQTRELILQ